MTRLLLLTSDGSVPDELVQAVAERAARDEVEVHVLVPVHPLPDAWAWDEEATRDAMSALLDEAIDRLRRTGVRVEGTIGCDCDPMVCVNRAMADEAFDEVIVATPRSGRARLLRMDLAARIGRAFEVPVTRVPVPGARGASAAA